jgi:hypothetical protein
MNSYDAAHGTHKPIFEAQIQPTDDGFQLVVTISVDEYYWTSLPMKLNATNDVDAKAEALVKINLFKKALAYAYE